MSFQEELFDKIEAYLNGELDATEVETFEAQIAVDQSLKQELEKHTFAHALILEQRLLSVKNILQTEKTKIPTSSPYKPLGLIALAIVSIGIGAFLLTGNEKVETRIVEQKNTLNKEASNKIQSFNTYTEQVSHTKTVLNSTESNSSTESLSPTIRAEQSNGFQKHQIQDLEIQKNVTKEGMLNPDSTKYLVKQQEQHPKLKAIENQVSSIVSVAPCADVSIEASIKVSPSCDEKATGIILVQEIKGGTKPYSISLYTINNESVQNGEIGMGTYEATITDSKGCIHTYSNIRVGQKECPIDYSFNPFYGNEDWYLSPQNFDGKLEIYDKGGVLYYQKNIPAHVANNWSGIGIGNEVVPGYYIFVIHYADGTIKKGSITIVQ